MAGLGRKTWTAGAVVTAADVQGYLQDQSVMVFAGTAARSSAIATATAGMISYLTDTKSLQAYGTAWADVTDPAILKSLLTTTGDLVYASGSATPTRLGIGGSGAILKSNGTAPSWLSAGTTGQVLTVSGGDAVWAAPVSPSQTLTLLTASGTWTVPAGVTRAGFFVAGGGAGGGGGGANPANGTAGGGFGGASAAYAVLQTLSVTPGDVWTAVIGGGGAGGAGGSAATVGVAGSAGSSGTDTTFSGPNNDLVITASRGGPTSNNQTAGTVSGSAYLSWESPGVGTNSLGNTQITQLNPFPVGVNVIGSNGATAPNGTIKGAGGTTTVAGLLGAGLKGQSTVNSTTLGTSNDASSRYGAGAPGGAAASSTSVTTIGGAGGAAAANSGAGGAGGGGATRSNSNNTVGGAGGNGGSGFVAILY